MNYGQKLKQRVMLSSSEWPDDRAAFQQLLEAELTLNRIMVFR
jgi:hypothetical protein